MNEIYKNKPLGRGLSSLLGPELQAAPFKNNSIVYVDILELIPGKYQPRHYFDPESLDSLVQSIKEKGVIQPIIVRPLQQSVANYEIIAGERRWQAAKKAGLREVPVLIKEMSDLEALETGLIENIQRNDLTPLEEAEGYKRLMEEFNYTQEILSQTLGKSRSHIANLLRLLGLPDSVKEMLNRGLLSGGHAKAIAGSKNVEEFARQIVKQGLNVRQAEKLTQKVDKNIIKPKNSQETNLLLDINEDIQSLEEQLSKILNVKVELSMTKKEKKLIVHFSTMEELEKIITRFSAGI